MPIWADTIKKILIITDLGHRGCEGMANPRPSHSLRDRASGRNFCKVKHIRVYSCKGGLQFTIVNPLYN